MFIRHVDIDSLVLASIKGAWYMEGQGMKGTSYVIGLIVYIASVVLPILLSLKAISFIHVALYAAFSLIIIAGATIDMYYYILPDEGAMALVLGGIIYSYINDKSMLITLLSVMSVGAITYGLRLMSHKGFGLGDVKWFSAIATWLTLWEIVCFFYVSFCVGSLYLLLTGYRNRYIPFGPFLCFGGWCALHGGLYMEVIYQWLRHNL